MESLSTPFKASSLSMTPFVILAHTPFVAIVCIFLHVTNSCSGLCRPTPSRLNRVASVSLEFIRWVIRHRLLPILSRVDGTTFVPSHCFKNPSPSFRVGDASPAHTLMFWELRKRKLELPYLVAPPHLRTSGFAGLILALTPIAKSLSWISAISTGYI